MIRTKLAEVVSTALATLGIDKPAAEVNLEQPARREHGDWSSNVALATAKPLGRVPRDLAAELVTTIEAMNDPLIDRVEIAGPGFVNFHLSHRWLTDVLVAAVEGGVDGFAKPTVGDGTSVLVEFVSANPTGPLHAGHARNAFYGDALARLLDRVGYRVGREFLINDRGSQMAKFAASIAARAAGIDVPEDGYHGQYIIDWADGMPADADPLEYGYQRALKEQREVLASAGIIFDTWFSEKALVATGAVEDTLADLATAGKTFEADGATWFRSTDFGDDKDRVLIKTNGDMTYLTPDIAYHRDKLRRGWDRLVDVWGADHHGYIVRMKGAIQALGYGPDVLDVRVTQLVKLLRNGEEVRLSKRAGDVVEMADVISEVGADAARITYLLQSIDSPQTIDLAKVAEQSMDNPVYYIQMAHTRLCSIARVAEERGIAIEPLAQADLSLLTHERELEVMRELFQLESTLLLAASERAPHRLTAWMRSMAAAVHGWYHDCPVLADSVDPATRQARLQLAEAARVGLRVGLDTLGVSAPREM